MNRINQTFCRLKTTNEKALVAYITAGHPSLSATALLIPALAKAGADIIEVGVPFSDPTADGPVIQRSSRQALAGGTNLAAIIQTIKEVRPVSPVPLVLFSYYNPVFAYGLERFAADARQAGIDAVLIVDLPPEEAPELKIHVDKAGLDFITLLAPTTSNARIKSITCEARGFLYLVSITGVTGSRAPEVNRLKTDCERIRSITPLPLVVGFGITTPAQAAAISPLADGIVIGSALVELIDGATTESDMVDQTTHFVAQVKKAINRIGLVTPVADNNKPA